MLLMVVASIFFLASAHGDPIRLVISVAILLCSLGAVVAFFASLNWCRRLSVVVFLLAGGFLLYNGATQGWNVTRITGPVCCCLAAIGSLRRPLAGSDSASEPPGMISIVGLVSELPFLDDAVLARHVQAAWGVTLDTTSDDPGDFVVGEAPLFVVRAHDTMFMVHYFDRPYFDDSEAVASSMRDLRVSHVIEQHKAWFSVDLMATNGADATDSDNYLMIAGLFAEIVDDHTLAMVFPAFHVCVPWEDQLEDILRSEDPLQAASIRHFPVVRVDANDPRMLALVDEARSRFEEFVAAFESRTSSEQTFAVKTPVQAGDNTEMIWVRVTGIENGVIYGELVTKPVDLGEMEMGDRVTSRVDDVNDWIFSTADGESTGGFSIQLLSDIYTEHADDEDCEDDPNTRPQA